MNGYLDFIIQHAFFCVQLLTGVCWLIIYLSLEKADSSYPFSERSFLFLGLLFIFLSFYSDLTPLITIVSAVGSLMLIFHVASWFQLVWFRLVASVILFPFLLAGLIVFFHYAILYYFQKTGAELVFLSFTLAMLINPLLLFFSFCWNRIEKKKGYIIPSETEIFKIFDFKRIDFFGEDFLLQWVRILSSHFKDFHWLALGVLNQDDLSFEVFDPADPSDSSRPGQHFSFPPKLAAGVSSMNKPLTKKGWSGKGAGFIKEWMDFFKQCTGLNECDLVMPLRTKNNVSCFLFLKMSEGHSDAPSQDELDRLNRVFQLLLNMLEQLGDEKDIREMFTQTRDKKGSYDLMAKKIEEVNEALSDLQKKQQKLIATERWISLSQITVTLNHEINNPLTHILGMSQILKAKMNKGHEIRKETFLKDIESIFHQCQRISEIIKSLRRISTPVTEKYLPEIEMIKLDIPHGEMNSENG
ncbi:MAG: hypothetical protein JW774_01010 [Candidatus Aureabacteria bacterium]|nr:hypothetical protein [Candidatus Auribacterota bacterium]